MPYYVQTVGSERKHEPCEPQRRSAKTKQLFATLPVTDQGVITKRRWTFYWLLTSKMSRIDEFSSCYNPASKAVAAAVKPYAEITSCAFKMIHAPHIPPSLPLSPLPDLLPRSHQQQLSLQLLHAGEVSVPPAEPGRTWR